MLSIHQVNNSKNRTKILSKDNKGKTGWKWYSYIQIWRKRRRKKSGHNNRCLSTHAFGADIFTKLYGLCYVGAGLICLLFTNAGVLYIFLLSGIFWSGSRGKLFRSSYFIQGQPRYVRMGFWMVQIGFTLESISYRWVY